VRKGGFEPPRLSAPPPQDGVSASSTTSAFCTLLAINSLTSSCCEGISGCTGFCTDVLHAPSAAATPQGAQTAVDCSLSQMYVAHRRLNVIVSGDILQRKGIPVLSGLSQKSVTQGVQACMLRLREKLACRKVFSGPSAASRLSNGGDWSLNFETLFYSRLDVRKLRKQSGEIYDPASATKGPALRSKPWPSPAAQSSAWARRFKYSEAADILWPQSYRAVRTAAAIAGRDVRLQ
jgi:hypothetical protein